MAVRNPEALYGGNANVFNFTPYVQYRQRQQALQQARADAVDNYYRDLTKGLTPSGMSPNDVNDFMQKVNAYKQHVITNKAALRNPSLDKGDAQIKANFLLNDAMELAERSKGKAKNIASAQKILQNPEVRNRLSDTSLEGFRKQSLPISNPEYQDYDMADLNFKPKPFDTKMQQGYLKGATQGLTMGDLIEGVTTDPKTLKATTTIKSTYNPDALQAINSRAEAAYYGDPSVKEFVDTNLSTPEMHDRLNNIFKSTYGVDIHNPSELFTAWTLDAVQNEKNNQKIADDKAAIMAQKQAYDLAKEKYKQAGKMAILGKKNEFKKEAKGVQDLILDDNIDEWLGEGLNNKPITYKTKEGVIDQRYPLPKTPEAMAVLSYKNSDGKTIRPDAIYLVGKDHIQPVFYNKDANGNALKGKDGAISVDESRSEPIFRNSYKLNLGKEMLSAKQRVAEMQGGNEEEPTKEVPKSNSSSKEYFYKGKKLDLTNDPDGLFKKK